MSVEEWHSLMDAIDREVSIRDQQAMAEDLSEMATEEFNSWVESIERNMEGQR
jgi:hypothetical protein